MKKRNQPAPDVTPITDDDIRAYAHHLYEQSGCRPNRDLDNWLEAKACLLDGKRLPRAGSAASARTPQAAVAGSDRGAFI